MIIIIMTLYVALYPPVFVDIYALYEYTVGARHIYMEVIETSKAAIIFIT